MTTTSPGRRVDAGTVNTLNLSYGGLVKAGQNSVIAAWKFGQCIDSFSHMYTLLQLADAMDLSYGCLYRYHRLYLAYQRPELALEVAEQIESFNIDSIWQLRNDRKPVPHGRPLAGRHWRGKCRNCGSHDVGREEVDKEGRPIPTAADVEEIVNGPGPQEAKVPQAQFSSGSGSLPPKGCEANTIVRDPLPARQPAGSLRLLLPAQVLPRRLRHGSAWIGGARLGSARPGRLRVAWPG